MSWCSWQTIYYNLTLPCTHRAALNWAAWARLQGQATGLPGFLGQLNFDDDKRGLRTSAFRTLSVFGTLLGALARFGLFCTVVDLGMKFYFKTIEI